jgi:hypothetical protein
MGVKQKRPRQMILPPYLGPKRPVNVFTAGVAALDNTNKLSPEVLNSE